MDEQPQLIKENSDLTQSMGSSTPIENKSSLRKKLDTIFSILLGVLIFCVVFAGIYYLGTGKSFVPQMKIATKPTDVTIKKEFLEVTEKTQVAKSLEVPTLYSELQWKEINKAASTESSMEITGFKTGDLENITKLPLLGGKIYTATGDASTYENVYNYYVAPLEKLRWVTGTNTTTDSLIFKSFTLEPIIADSPCGRINGYIGYKDGLVRVITEANSVSHCLPDSPENRDAVKHTIEYTIFISDPTPISYFTDYLAKHSK